MTLRVKRTKKQELTEQLAIEKAVRLGIIACFINLVAQHARVVGGDKTRAIADIQAALSKTVSSLKVNATDATGADAQISEFIQASVQKILESICRDALKQLSKPVH